MQTGEAAGFAAGLAHRQATTPGKLDQEELIRLLAERRQLISFFNDLKVDAKDPRIPAAEYFATKGFFHDYNARLDEPMKIATFAVWGKALKDLKANRLDARKVAEAVARAEAADGPTDAKGRTRGEVLKAMFERR
jgi:hypothetical protein